MSDSTPARRGPLAGLRVLDLTATLMGPYCTQILCDMGADVIKVESAAGDTTRYLQAAPTPGMCPMFVNLNRGKRSIVLDLKSEGGRQVLVKLAAQSDVFVHSMRFEAIKRLGFSYEGVKAIREDIVYANLYGYGRDGRYRDWPAYDDTIQGISGMAMLQAEIHGEPRYVTTVLADKVAGLTAAYAIAMALFHRERSGQGQEVEIAMFETMVSFLTAEHIGNGLYDPPGEPLYRRAIAPQRKPYRTSDGYISAMIYSDRQWNRFVEIAGSPQELLDPRFATLETRSRVIEEVYALTERQIGKRGTEEWIALLQEAGIPAVPLKSLRQLLHDPHLADVGFFVERETKEGALRFPGIPVKFSATPGNIVEAGPRLGEHTVEVLRGLGYPQAQIDAWIAQGVAAANRD